jgi:allophanate hydrolase
VRDEVLKIGSFGDSVCGYLAIEGGLAGPRVLGSASTYVRGGIGGLHGRRLQPRDVLDLKLRAVDRGPERALARPLDLRLNDPIRVVLGPQTDYFTDVAMRTFLSSDYVVSTQADRMGYRLQGAILAHRAGYDIVSDGIVTGSVQVPGSGQPIVLMVDNQTTGGYPKIATVVSADVPLVARRRPGRTIRFVEVDIVEAERLRKEQETALAQQISAMTIV